MDTDMRGVDAGQIPGSGVGHPLEPGQVGTGWSYLCPPAPGEGWHPWYGGYAFFTWSEGRVREGRSVPLIEATVHAHCCPHGNGCALFSNGGKVALFATRRPRESTRQLFFEGLTVPDMKGVAEQLMAERWLSEED